MYVYVQVLLSAFTDTYGHNTHAHTQTSNPLIVSKYPSLRQRFWAPFQTSRQFSLVHEQ